MKFKNHLVILGCGSVAQCVIPLIIKHLELPPQQITVIDFIDHRDKIPEGISYDIQKISPANYHKILEKHLHKGDLLLDLAWNIETLTLLIWCKEHDVSYVNTSIEEWDPFKFHRPEERTLYFRQMNIRKEVLSWGDKKTATAVLDHGANPGLISSFAKQGLLDIAHELLKLNGQRTDLEQAVHQQNFAKIAFLIGLKAIHISEKDSQISSKHRNDNEFVNTWSVMGLYEEGIAPAEIGWGTHEKKIPEGGMEHPSGPKNQIYLSTKGIDTWVESWVPSGPIKGMVIRHGEAFSLSEYLTYRSIDTAVYRPTIHYAYHPCEEALESIIALKIQGLKLQDSQRILENEIVKGTDELGCLFLGHELGVWWTGSILDIDEARKLVPGQNATTVQVSSGIIAALLYCIEHPNEGVCLPERLPHEYVLKIAKPYLGKFISLRSEWRPTKREGNTSEWEFYPLTNLQISKEPV